MFLLSTVTNYTIGIIKCAMFVNLANCLLIFKQNFNHQYVNLAGSNAQIIAWTILFFSPTNCVHLPTQVIKSTLSLRFGTTFASHFQLWQVRKECHFQLLRIEALVVCFHMECFHQKHMPNTSRLNHTFWKACLLWNSGPYKLHNK